MTGDPRGTLLLKVLFTQFTINPSIFYCLEKNNTMERCLKTILRRSPKSVPNDNFTTQMNLRNKTTSEVRQHFGSLIEGLICQVPLYFSLNSESQIDSALVIITDWSYVACITHFSACLDW